MTILYIPVAIHCVPSIRWIKLNNTILLFLLYWQIMEMQTWDEIINIRYQCHYWQSSTHWSEITMTYISWWRHHKKTLSILLAIWEGNHRLPVDFAHISHWPEGLIFTVLLALINCWINIRTANNLRHHGSLSSLYWSQGPMFTPPNTLQNIYGTDYMEMRQLNWLKLTGYSKGLW